MEVRVDDDDLKKGLGSGHLLINFHIWITDPKSRTSSQRLVISTTSVPDAPGAQKGKE